MDSQDPAPDIKSEPLSVKVRERTLLERKELWAVISSMVGYACWRLFFGE